MRRTTRTAIASVAVLLAAVVTPVGAAGAARTATAARASSPDPAALHAVFKQVVSGLAAPVFVTSAGDGSGRLFVVEQGGQVRVVRHGRLLRRPYLDIGGKVATSYDEQGLLSIAFHPNFTKHPFIYVAYTRRSDNALQVSRFRAPSAGATHLSAGSERHIIAVPHPHQLNHNGGQLLFDRKGRLLVTTGDGGGGGDPYDNARDLTSLNGKILRLVVDRSCGSAHYCVPRANPFPKAHNAHKRVVFDWGLRNPWRVSFDRADGSLWIGDVGQDNYEEIDHARESGGRDFGWSCREGRRSYNSDRCTIGGKPRHLTGPVHVYPHTQGRCAVIGGYDYRGSKYRFARGVYIYADYCGGQVYGLARRSGGGYRNARIGALDGPTGFGQSHTGELYAVTGGGGLYRVVFHRG